MQRKSTRKAASITQEDKEDTIIAEEGSRSIREIKDAVFADLGLRNFFTIVKYTIIILIILPWIIQINSKVKQNGVLPRLQDFFLETFTCPELVYNSTNCNCTNFTVDDKKSNSPSL